MGEPRKASAVRTKSFDFTLITLIHLDPPRSNRRVPPKVTAIQPSRPFTHSACHPLPSPFAFLCVLRVSALNLVPKNAKITLITLIGWTQPISDHFATHANTSRRSGIKWQRRPSLPGKALVADQVRGEPLSPSRSQLTLKNRQIGLIALIPLTGSLRVPGLRDGRGVSPLIQNRSPPSLSGEVRGRCWRLSWKGRWSR